MGANDVAPPSTRNPALDEGSIIILRLYGAFPPPASARGTLDKGFLLQRNSPKQAL